MGVAISVVAVIIILILYFVYNPADYPLAPKCGFKSITGYDCPGCGSQRLLHGLLHGDIGAAWHANPFLLCLLPLLFLMIGASLTRKRFPRFYAVMNSPAMILGTGVSLMVWWVIRNLYGL